FAAGHPAIVARGDASEPAGTLRLGVPLPPDEGKQRLGLRLHRDEVAHTAAPPSLAAVAAASPHPALHALARDACALAPRVFGSHAWQALTGLAYVGPESDLDLLWSVEDAVQADAIAALLQGWEARHGLRADGELVVPGGVAVNWREYASAARQLLVKSHHDCRLLPREALFASPHAPGLSVGGTSVPTGPATKSVGTEVPPTGENAP
ncbi:MAG: malonate decarboxylase holo-[acyl-carrier-protein] synthase, partial [Pseudomonas sp.]